jgi:2-keto-myo-inositol isomerase
MISIDLNLMTAQKPSTIEFLEIAESLGEGGIKLRNDQCDPMFDGKGATWARDEVAVRGLRILALAGVYGFSDNTDETRKQTLELAHLAQECGAEAISVTPRIANVAVPTIEQRVLLRTALNALKQMLEDIGVTALIEPLGFANSSLRLKADAMAVLDDMGRPDCFALIHDTFYHALSGESAVFGDTTRIVHISGVNDSFAAPADMTDAHCGLVGPAVRLGNIAQIKQLRTQGFAGPYSFKAFALDVHDMTDLARALSTSTNFITSQLADLAA